MAHAARTLVGSVVVCDIGNVALDRMKSKIHPIRYNQWDSSIELYHIHNAPAGGFDLIYVGTASQYHINLVLQAVSEHPRAIPIEKPYVDLNRIK